EGGQWVRQKGARRLKPTRGPSYRWRISRGFIEVAERPVGASGGAEVWEPVLKLGARSGTSWTWQHGNVEHRSTLVRFDRHRGRPSVVIEEVIRTQGSPRAVEVRRVYVEDVGEVERQERLRIDSRQAPLLREKRLVEETESGKSLPRE